ncbi:MAG: hypothetical protein H6735_01580 [Alphaproteobacteria bacterium]|nr:hypothetical protein [Alphaproteobacteria bacterium]
MSTSDRLAGKYRLPADSDLLPGVHRAEGPDGRAVGIELSDRVERSPHHASRLALWRSLADPHLVRLLDHGASETGSWLATEHVFGTTLAEAVESGAMDLSRALHVGQQLCEALSAAHRAGLVHGDLRADDIWITRHGAAWNHVKLGGFARVYQRPHNPASAPEHVPGRIPGPTEDVYAIAAIVAFACSGGTWTEPDDGPALASAPASLEWALRTALRRDANERFATVDQLGRALTVVVAVLDDPTRWQHVPRLEQGHTVVPPELLDVVEAVVGSRQEAEASPLMMAPTPAPLPNRVTPPRPQREQEPPPPVTPISAPTTPPPMLPVEQRRGSNLPLVGALVLVAIGLLAIAIVGLGFLVSGVARTAGGPPATPEPAPVSAPALPPSPEPAPVATTPEQVTIVSVPPGAEVRDGDRTLGTTPLVLEVREQDPERTLVLALDGHEPFQVVLGFGGGDRRVSADLVPVRPAQRPRPVAPTTPRPVRPEPAPEQAAPKGREINLTR